MEQEPASADGFINPLYKDTKVREEIEKTLKNEKTAFLQEFLNSRVADFLIRKLEQENYKKQYIPDLYSYATCSVNQEFFKELVVFINPFAKVTRVNIRKFQGGDYRILNEQLKAEEKAILILFEQNNVTLTFAYADGTNITPPSNSLFLTLRTDAFAIHYISEQARMPFYLVSFS